MTDTSRPKRDVLAALPKPARELLAGAKRVLEREGLSALSLQAIAKESGQHKALIAYYFGDKAGLLAVLADSVTSEAEEAFQTEIATLDADARIDLARDHWRRISTDSHAYLVILEVMSYAIKDQVLRERLAESYQGYRELNLDVLAPGSSAEERQALLPIAALMLAVIDGLAIQQALDPDSELWSRAWSTWATLLKAVAAHDVDENVIQS